MSFLTGRNSSSSTKEKVKEFIAITNSSEKIATKLLKENGWNTDVAIDQYYAQQGTESVSASSTVDRQKLDALFNNYKDKNTDAILVEGTETLCNDLQIDPMDVVTLVLAWHLQCPRMCEFRRAGWLAGWTKLCCDSIEKMRAVLPSLREELDDPAKFKDIYHFTFQFARSEGQKGLGLETAIAFWQLLLAKSFSRLDLWVEFLTTQHKKDISKDTWNLFLEFIRTTDGKLENHDKDGAWPVLIDSFVDYVQSKESSAS